VYGLVWQVQSQNEREAMTAKLEQRRTAWSVHAIIYSQRIVIKKNMHSKTFHKYKPKSKIVVYRSYFIKLLNTPKPVRDQLIMELPILMAFRTAEISTVRGKHVDFEHGDLQVFDSKKFKYFTVPLDMQVAQHLEQLIRETGYTDVLFQPLQKGGRKGKDPYLSNTAIEYVWTKWCKKADIPCMAPRMGRAYFAVNWHVVEGKSIIGLMNILRHDNILSTEQYLNKIHSYEDVKAEFFRGKTWSNRNRCARYELCPLAALNCHCHLFTPTMEVKNKVDTSRF